VILCEVKCNNESRLTRELIRDLQRKVDAFLAATTELSTLYDGDGLDHHGACVAGDPAGGAISRIWLRAGS
jgi:hypothetical protein